MTPEPQNDKSGLDAARQVSQGRPIKLATWGRVLAGVVGLASMGAGGTATFTRTVEAGPVALIASGLLLFLVSLGGWLPRRLKLGANEAEWEEELGEALGAVVSKLPPASRDDIAEALEGLEAVSPSAAAATYRGYARHQMLIDVLRGMEIPGVRVRLESSGADSGYDAIAEAVAGGRAVFIALKVTHLRSRDLEPARRQLRAAMQAWGIDKAKGVVLTPYELTPLAQKLAEEDPQITVVAIPSVDHVGKVEAAIKEALRVDS